MPDSQASRLSLLIVIAVALFGLGTFLSNPSAPKLEADPDNADQVALGTTVYMEHCASCHGENLEGEPNWRSRNADGFLPAPPHDPSGHTWHHPDEQLFAMTKFGIAAAAGLEDYPSDMPIYEDVLTDAEIWAVLAFIKSQWPQEIRARQPRIE